MERVWNLTLVKKSYSNRVRRKLDFDLDEQSLLLGFSLYVYACLLSCLRGGEGIVVLVIIVTVIAL